MKKKFKCKGWPSSLGNFRSMKIFVLFMLLAVFQLNAEVKSQEASLSINKINVSLIEVLKLIEAQSEYTCLYSYGDVEKVVNLTIDLKNASVKEVLDICLKGTKLGYKIVDQTIVIRGLKELEQKKEAVKEKSITGRVTDAKKEALPGVTILVKGTTIGVVTDAEGNYKISLPDQKDITLVFSFIGMVTKEVKVTNQKEINVVLEEDVEKLDEVVVTGYNNIKKSSFTGNATMVTKDELMKVNNKSIISAIQAFDPSFRIKENSLWGSDPNALPEFNIRGESSIGMKKGLDVEDMKKGQRTSLKDNPNLPIFILDGFEVSVQKIYDMDMNRMESLTILKDAAATAMYGSRAANGVIVITTVAPKPGELRVTYNLTTAFEFPDLSDYNLCNAAEKLELERLSGVYKAKHESGQLNMDMEYNDLLLQVQRGIDTDWMAQPLRNAFNHKHSAYIEGGVETVRYGVDFNYDSNNGVMKGSHRSRMGAGLTLDYRYKKLQVRNYVSYNSTRAEDSPYGTFSEYAKMQPYYRINDDDGNIIECYDEFGSDVNPIYKTTLENYTGKYCYNELINNLNVNWYILDGLQFKGQFSVTKTDATNESFVDPKDYQFRQSEIKEKGRLDQNFENGYNWNLNALFTFNKAIGKHFVNATMGINVTENQSKSRSMVFKGFQLGSLHSPEYAAQQDEKTQTNTIEQRLFGFLGSVNYSYNDIYLFDGSYRLDGSSQFGSDKRFAPFWSLGAGVNIHNYDFLKDNRYLSQLKVRASYGSTGKVNFPAYTAVTTYSTDVEHWYYTGPASYLVYLGNTDLKWETTKTLDIGFDIGFFADRFQLTADYYHKATEDMIDEVYIRTSSGFEKYRSNAGTVVNKGVDITLRGTVYKTKDWMVTVMGTLASNKNEITKLGAASEAYNKTLDENYDAKYPSYVDLVSKPLQKYKKGASTTAIYAVRSAGIDPANGKEKFIKKSGVSTYTYCADDQIVMGDLTPDAQGSFGLNVGYKGFYLNTSFLFQWGGQTYNETLINKVENANIEKENVDKRVLTQRWRYPGDIVPYYDMQYDRVTKPTSRFVQDYNHLSFSGLSVGYDFRKELIERIKLKSLGLSFNATDIVRWSSVKEERGTSYPYARSFSFTLNIGL